MLLKKDFSLWLMVYFLGLFVGNLSGSKIASALDLPDFLVWLEDVFFVFCLTIFPPLFAELISYYFKLKIDKAFSMLVISRLLLIIIAMIVHYYLLIVPKYAGYEGSDALGTEEVVDMAIVGVQCLVASLFLIGHHLWCRKRKTRQSESHY